MKDVYHWEATTTIPRTTNNSTEESLYKNVAENSQSAVPVSIHNIEKYLELTLGFCLDKGIRKQLDAFKGIILHYFSLIFHYYYYYHQLFIKY